jgi:glycosyltransferase involved in cell wall biosynthesis
MEKWSMQETVDVVVATYGDLDYWEPFATRAVTSAWEQVRPPDHVFHFHDPVGTDLSTVRNAGASASTADWLIFLDADDELDGDYVRGMLSGEGDLRWPSTLGIVDGVPDDFPVLLQPRYDNFLVGNHMVIGTMVRRDLFNTAGGFRPGLTSLEDWDLFIRCLLAGGIARPCPEAIYKVHVQSGSRNQNTEEHGRNYTEIQQRYGAQWNLRSLT